MSLDMYVFVKDIDDLIIPKWLEELNKLSMTCEIHPDFSFKDQSGFLPFKINVSENSHEELMNISCLSGFELDVDNFILSEHTKPKKQSLIDKLFKRPVETRYFANPEMDIKLEKYKKIIYFNWGSSDTFELRMAVLGSATLAKITDGICWYPADDLWYNNDTIIEDAVKEVSDYEKSLKPEEINIQKFEKWL